MIAPVKRLLAFERPSLTLSAAALVAANLLPLAGVLFLHWDAATIVLLYWAENLVIGGYQVLKMALLKTEHPIQQLGKLVAIPFFCLHFGGFCAVHGLFLVGLLRIGGGFDSVSPGGGGWGVGPLVFLELLMNVIRFVWNARPPGSNWAFYALAASHGVSFIEYFLRKKEYAAASMSQTMMQPYGRIVVMHFTVVLGAIPALLLGSPVGLLCILVLIKTWADLAAHGKAHKSARGADRDREPGDEGAPAVRTAEATLRESARRRSARASRSE
ncbi:MAG: hypothetical protein KBD56_03885 [Candidatus Eisenbacteria bacterium]|nr:hypothetical protein [Candidatus Eisenbacteria bacterium]